MNVTENSILDFRNANPFNMRKLYHIQRRTPTVKFMLRRGKWGRLILNLDKGKTIRHHGIQSSQIESMCKSQLLHYVLRLKAKKEEDEEEENFFFCCD